jgi:nitrite reductase/ring-hydroxylating ferredoxin subunit
MQNGEVVVSMRRPRRGFGVGAAVALATTLGSAVWAYAEYVTRARTTWLALAVTATFFAVSATVLLAFRAAFPFASVQGPRPMPSLPASPLPLDPQPRRGFIALLAGAAASLVAVLLLPLRSLGTRPREVLRATAWRRGVRVLTPEGTALRANDLPFGSFALVVPESSPDDSNSAAVLVRLRGSGDVRAFSRVCTHSGCVVCVFRPEASLLVCPCHHSTFDAAAGGKVVSGPASQALPELPLAVDSEGCLVANGDFNRRVGPLAG